MKKEKIFLKEIDKFALQNSLKNLSNAYSNFFKKQKRTNLKFTKETVEKANKLGKSLTNYDMDGHPKFKNKHNNFNSYRTNFTNNNIEIFKKSIKLPKLKLIKRKGYKNIEGKIISATISKNTVNQYYCSLLIEKDIIKLPEVTSTIGIDLGIKNFAILSNGEVILNHNTLNKYESKLKKEQKRLSSKEKGSNNYKKQQYKLAKVYNKIKNIRHDFLNKITTKLIKENQIICLEDLNVKGMLQNHHLAKAISNLGINEFENKLKYKANWYGRVIQYVDRFYPSSQLCHECGSQNPLVKNLSIREWICPKCNTIHDRDLNAALNIKKEGLRLYHLNIV